jgi:hypothetical protein
MPVTIPALSLIDIVSVGFFGMIFYACACFSKSIPGPDMASPHVMSVTKSR